MAVAIASSAATSLAANVKGTNEVSGQYEFIAGGSVYLVVLPSATGMNCTLTVGGEILIDDQEIPYFGTSGSMSNDNLFLAPQGIGAGRVVLTFRNTTAGTITIDYALYWAPPVGKR